MKGNFIARFFRRGPVMALLLAAAISSAAAIACSDGAVAQPEMAPATLPPPPSGQPPPMATGQSDIADFVGRQEDLSTQWDAIRDDFDQWSGGLDSCRPGTMRQALNEFAVSFNEVTEQARGLTRREAASELADLLIVAAEEEEAAFRRLRDHWQPGSVSLFENVDLKRAAAARARQAAEDRAIELRTAFENRLASSAEDESRAEFARQFDLMARAWAQMHKDYANLRQTSNTLDADVAAQFVEKLVIAIDALETLSDAPAGTEAAIEALQTAAEDELAAFQSAAEPLAPPSTPAPADPEAPDGSAEEPEFDIDEIDAAVIGAEKALQAASDLIGKTGAAEGESEIDPEQGLVELQAFRTEYSRLVRAWDAFHDGYNEWRSNEGGCDRVEVIRELDKYSRRVSRLAREVRALPSAGGLLPVYTLLTDAASREENAFISLRNTWQPFTLDAFRAVHQERINVDGLRRQADIAVQELQSRF